MHARRDGWPLGGPTDDRAPPPVTATAATSRCSRCRRQPPPPLRPPEFWAAVSPPQQWWPPRSGSGGFRPQRQPQKAGPNAATARPSPRGSPQRVERKRETTHYKGTTAPAATPRDRGQPIPLAAVGEPQRCGGGRHGTGPPAPASLSAQAPCRPPPHKGRRFRAPRRVGKPRHNAGSFPRTPLLSCWGACHDSGMAGFARTPQLARLQYSCASYFGHVILLVCASKMFPPVNAFSSSR